MVFVLISRLGVAVVSGALAINTPAPPAPLDQPNTITVSGCLLLGPYGDYTLSTTLDPVGAVRNSVAWKLENKQQLLAHILEQVEVTGSMTPALGASAAGAAGGRSAGRGGTTNYWLRVQTIRKVGACE